MPNLLPLYVTTYSTRTPYVTTAEFLNTPTGIDAENILADGTSLTETQTLQNLLLRASGWADTICGQILCATVDTRVGKFRLQRDNTLRVPLPYWPVINVTGIKTGYFASTMADTTDWANAWMGSGGVLEIPLLGVTSIQAGPPPLSSPYSRNVGDQLYVQVTYVNGWANSAFTASVSAGATSLPIGNALGIAPGQQLAVYSQTAGEVVTVSQSWTAPTVAGPASVPITAGLANAYSGPSNGLPGDTVTAMPQEIKQAVILLASTMIKTRGAEALEMTDMSSTPHSLSKGEGMDEYEEAHDLLANYRRIGF